MAIQLVVLVAATGAMLVARRAYRRTRALQRALQARLVVELVRDGRADRYLSANVAQLVAAHDYSGTRELLWFPYYGGGLRVTFVVPR